MKHLKIRKNMTNFNGEPTLNSKPPRNCSLATYLRIFISLYSSNACLNNIHFDFVNAWFCQCLITVRITMQSYFQLAHFLCCVSHEKNIIITFLFLMTSRCGGIWVVMRQGCLLWISSYISWFPSLIFRMALVRFGVYNYDCVHFDLIFINCRNGRHWLRQGSWLIPVHWHHTVYCLCRSSCKDDKPIFL